MSKITKFIGIDISKKVFDVWSQELGHKQFENNKQGYEQFGDLLDSSSWCVMEYTGTYYQQLALYLHNNSVDVSLENPLVIKRFIQMRLTHNKTDKSDARMICLYAQDQKVHKWQPKPEYIEKCKDLHTTVILYLKQTTALKNKLTSFLDKGIKGMIITSLKRQIRQANKEILLLESEMEILVKKHEAELFSNIRSIKGIGKKTAILLIVCTDGFRTFEKASQVSAFFGLAPVERTSGTSIRGRMRISKRGNPLVRNHLFMCSFTACNTNHQCNKLYNRIINKGKSKKLALIAVTNKLIKQAFAIAKSGIPYDPNFQSVLIPK